MLSFLPVERSRQGPGTSSGRPREEDTAPGVAQSPFVSETLEMVSMCLHALHLRPAGLCKGSVCPRVFTSGPGAR